PRVDDCHAAIIKDGRIEYRAVLAKAGRSPFVYRASRCGEILVRRTAVVIIKLEEIRKTRQLPPSKRKAIVVSVSGSHAPYTELFRPREQRAEAIESDRRTTRRRLKMRQQRQQTRRPLILLGRFSRKPCENVPRGNDPDFLAPSQQLNILEGGHALLH